MSTVSNVDCNALPDLYERDFYAWAMQNAELIRQRRLAEIDTDNSSRSWRLTIAEQRRGTARLLRDNPSLKASIDKIMVDAYGDAILSAAKETGLSRSTNAGVCPFTLTQVLDESCLPED